MKKRSASPSTILLVVALLAALYAIGKMVNPPPPGPPVAVAAPLRPAHSAEEMKQHMSAEKLAMENAKKMADYRKSHPGMMPGGNHSKPSPAGIDISSDYFRTHPMGDVNSK